MDEEEFDSELSTLDSLEESAVLDFLSRHFHDPTTCNFCSDLMDDMSESVVTEVLGRYREISAGPPVRVVEALCSALGPIDVGQRRYGLGPPMTELFQLTKLPECAESVYEKVVSSFSPSFYNEVEWTLEDVKKFVLERAQLPNAPIDFAKRAVQAFHDCRHLGPVEACTDCQPIIRQANRED